MKYVYTTLPRMRRVMRDRYRAEIGLRRLRAALWLLNNCNDTQLGNVFGKEGAELAALKARLQNNAAKLASWEAERDQMRAAELAAQSVEGE